MSKKSLALKSAAKRWFHKVPAPVYQGSVTALVSAMIAIAVVSCGPLKPTLQVTNNGSSLMISGAGFYPSPSPNCVQLSLLRLPAPNAVLGIATASCDSTGSFKMTWSYRYAFCNPSNTQSVVVAGVDTQSNSASQTISFAWGPGCNLTQFCGAIGQPACNGQCQSGGVGPDGTCQLLCGGEGQAQCSAGASCLPGLHPNQQGASVMCTASCGNAPGTPCTLGPNNGSFCSGNPPVINTFEPACMTQQSTAGNGSPNYQSFACYGGSTIPANGTCICQPAAPTLSCQVNTSPTWPNVNAGICLPGGPILSAPKC
jgi:hypothetical protein